MDKSRLDPVLLGVSVATLAGGLIADLLARQPLANGLWAAGSVLLAMVISVEIVRSLLRRQAGVDLIALLSILAALAFSEFLVASVIGVMLASGRTLEYFASRRAERELKRMIQRAPSVAWQLNGSELVCVPLQQVTPGQLILVRMGDVVPLDGRLEGSGAALDESALTGEPIPVSYTAGHEIRSGTLNVGAPFALRVLRSAEESTYAGIVRMALNARRSRAPFVRAADRYALLLIPTTLLIAGTAWFWSGDSLRALAVMVVSTPCPLILAVPVAILSGISRCARRGILIKDGATLEALADTRTVLLDKTGTLTLGHPRVTGVETQGEMDAQRLLYLAGSLAQGSRHPVSKAIAEAARAANATLALPSNVVETPGAGLYGDVDEQQVRLGGPAFVASQADPWAQSVMSRLDYQGLGASLVAVDGVLAGAILFADPLRQETARALGRIRRMGVARIVMLTGDRLETAEVVAMAAGVDEIRAGLSPEDKVKAVQQYCATGATMMVGDGINDAPALAAADVGVAMGASGASAASESAGVVLMVDRLDRVVEALVIARRSYRIARQSLLIGIGLSVLAMLVAAAGYLPPLVGAVVQEVIDVGVILNALRAVHGAAGRAVKGLTRERLQQLAEDHSNMAHVLQRLGVAARNLTNLPFEQAKAELDALLALLDEQLIPHERDDEARLYPSLIDHLQGEDPLVPLSHTHRELFRLVGLLRQLHRQLPSQPSTAELMEVQILLIRLDTLLTLHFAQEDELYHALDLQ